MELLHKLPEDLKVPGEDWDSLMWLNGKLYSGSFSNGVVSVWTHDLQPVTQFTAHDHPIYHIVSARDTKTFFTSSSDCTIKHWEEVIESGGVQFRLLKVLEGHSEPARKLRVFNKQLFSGDELGNVFVWEVDTGRLIGRVETMEEIWDMQVFPNNHLITVRHLDVTIFNVHMKEAGGVVKASVKNSFPGRGPLLIVSGDNYDKYLVCVDRNKNVVTVHRLESHMGQSPVWRFSGHERIINAITSSGNKLVSGSTDKFLMIWNFENTARKDAGERVPVEGYVNVLETSSEGWVYAAGENKFISCFKPF